MAHPVDVDTGNTFSLSCLAALNISHRSQLHWSHQLMFRSHHGTPSPL